MSGYPFSKGDDFVELLFVEIALRIDVYLLIIYGFFLNYFGILKKASISLFISLWNFKFLSETMLFDYFCSSLYISSKEVSKNYGRLIFNYFILLS